MKRIFLASVTTMMLLIQLIFAQDEMENTPSISKSQSTHIEDSVIRKLNTKPINRQIIFYDDFSTNQGWTGLGRDGEWAIGPAGGGFGNDEYGGPDPSYDHTTSPDNMLLGTDLDPGLGGDYNPNLTTTYWVISPYIDCTDFTNVTFTFWRWLGVERNLYDHVFIQVYDGFNWFSIFENDDIIIDDSYWSEYIYDVSDYADYNSSFRIRFGIGETDGSWQYCGWNIDDIEISGIDITPPDVSIDMIPDEDPVYVTQGGFFTFTGILDNNTSESRKTDVWIMLGVPQGGQYGPIQVFNNIPLGPFQHFEATGARQDIPQNAPTGLYDYIAYSGDYPSSKMDSAAFEFMIFPGISRNNMNNWNLTGWFDDDGSTVPYKTGLVNNFPNPFNAVTTISYDLAEEGDVTLEIFNLLGQKVETLVNNHQIAGHHSVTWDASKNSSGVYIFKLSVNDEQFVKRMTLLK